LKMLTLKKSMFFFKKFILKMQILKMLIFAKKCGFCFFSKIGSFKYDHEIEDAPYIKFLKMLS
jgi:hypothetical protein